MEEQQQQNALAAAFPAPPPFWQNFTPENLNRISELRAAQSQASAKSDPAIELPIRLLDLPAELRCLQPPEPPAEGIYRCFGDQYNVRLNEANCSLYLEWTGMLIDAWKQMNDPLPSLEDQGIPRLYTPPDTPTGTNGKHNMARQRPSPCWAMRQGKCVVSSSHPTKPGRKPAAMCSTINTGTGNSLASRPRMVFSTSGPPVEAPMATRRISDGDERGDASVSHGDAASAAGFAAESAA